MSDLVKALAEARKNMNMPSLNGEGHAGRNGSRTYKYALLGDVLNSIVPALAGQGVFLTQGITEDGTLVTAVMKDDEVLQLDKRKVNLSGTSQEQGSAETYAKRYALCTVFGLSGIEDDDGAAAQQQPTPKARKQAQPKKPGRFERVSALKAEALSLGIKEEGIKSWLDATFGKPMKDFTDAEIAETEGYLASLVSDKRSLAEDSPYDG